MNFLTQKIKKNWWHNHLPRWFGKYIWICTAIKASWSFFNFIFLHFFQKLINVLLDKAITFKILHRRDLQQTLIISHLVLILLLYYFRSFCTVCTEWQVNSVLWIVESYFWKFSNHRISHEFFTIAFTYATNCSKQNYRRQLFMGRSISSIKVWRFKVSHTA